MPLEISFILVFSTRHFTFIYTRIKWQRSMIAWTPFVIFLFFAYTVKLFSYERDAFVGLVLLCPLDIHLALILFPILLSTNSTCLGNFLISDVNSFENWSKKNFFFLIPFGKFMCFHSCFFFFADSKNRIHLLPLF